MFIKKNEYYQMTEQIKKLESMVNKQMFELFFLKNNEKYQNCSLPNKVNEIIFDGIERERGLLEFLLLASKKGIDVSEINISDFIHEKYIFIFIRDNKATSICTVPLDGNYLSASQRMNYDNRPKWSNIRKSFEKYIED